MTAIRVGMGDEVEKKKDFEKVEKGETSHVPSTLSPASPRPRTASSGNFTMLMSFLVIIEDEKR